jgi:hypothetical protein
VNIWAVVIILFAVALLPWQIFRYARRKNPPIAKSDVRPMTGDRDDSDSSSW